MPRAIATYEAVKQAAVTLMARGEPITLERLRVLIGHGSYTTIRQHFQRFQQVLREQPKAQWPAAVPENLLTGLETLWQTAMETAEGQYQTLNAAAQTKVRTAAQQAQDLQQQLTVEQQQREALAYQLATAREQIQTLAKDLAVAQDRLATRQAVFDELQQRETEAQQVAVTAKAEVDRFRQQAEQAEVAREAMHAQWIAQTEALTQLQRALAGSDQEREALLQQLAKAEQRMAAVQQAGAETAAALEQRLREMRKERDQQAQQRHALEQQLTAAELRRAEAEREAEVLGRQFDALAYRLAQGGTKPTKPPPRKPSQQTRSR